MQKFCKPSKSLKFPIMTYFEYFLDNLLKNSDNSEAIIIVLVKGFTLVQMVFMQFWPCFILPSLGSRQPQIRAMCTMPAALSAIAWSQSLPLAVLAFYRVMANTSAKSQKNNKKAFSELSNHQFSDILALTKNIYSNAIEQPTMYVSDLTMYVSDLIIYIQGLTKK
jgi:hypothetical protein